MSGTQRGGREYFELMRIHHRVHLVQEAESEIRKSLLNFQRKHNLTDVEFLHILTGVQQTTLRYMLQEEEHESDKPGDITNG